MKNYLTFSFYLFAFSFSLSAFAAPDDLLVSFSTKGPDTYLDGSVVKDGECYALVWTKTGATFGGFAADGTLVGEGSKVLVFAPLAKGGRCPSVLFELDAAFAAGLKGGEYALYLLDTRLAGGRLGGVNAKGVPVAVNGYGEVKVKGEGEGEQRSGSGSSVCVTTKSAVPADAPKPRITAIKLVGDKVFLTVKGTLPCLQYAAKEVSVDAAKGALSVDAASRRVCEDVVDSAQTRQDAASTGNAASTGDGESSSVQTRQDAASTGDGESSSVQTRQDAASTGNAASTQGASSVDEEIVVIAPKKGESGFFSVGRE